MRFKSIRLLLELYNVNIFHSIPQVPEGTKILELSMDMKALVGGHKMHAEAKDIVKTIPIFLSETIGPSPLPLPGRNESLSLAVSNVTLYIHAMMI
jgi:hypothetical protein